MIRQKSSRKQGLLFVISGPSGSGKTTLAGRILKDKTLNKKLYKTVSFTTRPRRSGERDKRDYFFISGSLFKQQLRQKKILEWTSYLGYYYGTPKAAVDRQLKQGRHLVLCIDLRGVKNIKRLYPENSVAVFIMPPDLEELRRRIRARCAETRESEVRQRMRLAKKEMRAASKFDYCLVNKDLKDTVRQLRRIILTRIGK